MSKLSQVFEGWKNHLTPAAYLLETISKVHVERMEICHTCPYNSKNDATANPLRFDEHCTRCGCTLSAKTKCLSCSCPINKWNAVITDEEESLIEKKDETASQQ